MSTAAPLSDQSLIPQTKISPRKCIAPLLLVPARCAASLRPSSPGLQLPRYALPNFADPLENPSGLLCYNAAQATLANTHTAHNPNTIPKLAPGFTFFGFAAEKPMATNTRHQIKKSSSDPPSASSGFGALSGR